MIDIPTIYGDDWGMVYGIVRVIPAMVDVYTKKRWYPGIDDVIPRYSQMEWMVYRSYPDGITWYR